MNFVTARLVRDGAPAAVFADHILPLPERLLSHRPGLGAYLGRQVILGIRPADFEDARLADPDWARISTTAEVIEELGSEIHVLFALQAPPVRHASVADALETGADSDQPADLAGGKLLWTARAAAHSAVRPGQPITLAVNTANLQFFDPDTAKAIGHPIPPATLAISPGPVR